MSKILVKENLYSSSGVPIYLNTKKFENEEEISTVEVDNEGEEDSVEVTSGRTRKKRGRPRKKALEV